MLICSRLLFTDCLINLLALTILFISRERVQGLGRHRTEQVNWLKVQMMKNVLGIWTFSFFMAIPTFFSAQFMQHVHLDGRLHSACIKVDLVLCLMSWSLSLFLTWRLQIQSELMHVFQLWMLCICKDKSEYISTGVIWLVRLTILSFDSNLWSLIFWS